MQTRDPDTAGPAEEAPPGWVLNTPNRLFEVWTYPVLALVLAAAHAFFGIALGGALALAVGVSAAILITVGAVALFVTGWRAYDEQTLDASWRCHVTRVVVGATVAAVIWVASLLVGLQFGLLIGVAAATMLYTTARAVPRFDHLVVAWASAVVAATCATLAVVALLAHDLPESRSAAWMAGGVSALLSALLAVHQFRAAGRGPQDEPEPGLSAPDRTAS